MIANKLFMPLLLLAITTPLTVQANILITGEIASKNSEVFYAPRVTGWQIQIQWMMPEGQIAKPGELVVLFERASVDSEIEMKQADLLKRNDQLALAKSNGTEGLMDAEFAFQKAKLELAKTQIEADISKQYVSAYDHEKVKVELERKRLAVEKAQRQLVTKREEVKTDITKKNTEIKKTESDLALMHKKSALTAQKTKIGGPIIYGNHPWNGSKIASGSSVQATWKVAEIASSKDVRVLAWLNEVDKGSIKVGDEMSITVDAITGKKFDGTISHIVPQAEAREAWGTAAYFQVEIDIRGYENVELVPGMSVLVEAL
jgi:multidrug resistance efflux pump